MNNLDSLRDKLASALEKLETADAISAAQMKRAQLIAAAEPNASEWVGTMRARQAQSRADYISRLREGVTFEFGPQRATLHEGIKALTTPRRRVDFYEGLKQSLTEFLDGASLHSVAKEIRANLQNPDLCLALIVGARAKWPGGGGAFDKAVIEFEDRQGISPLRRELEELESIVRAIPEVLK